MIQLISWVTSHSDQILDIATKIVAASSAFAAITPTPKDDTFVGKMYKIVDWLALNIGKAKDSGTSSDKEVKK